MLTASISPINAGIMTIPLSAAPLQPPSGSETMFIETGVARLSDRFEQWMTPYAAQLHAVNILSPEITCAFASAAVYGVIGLPIGMGTLSDFLRGLLGGKTKPPISFVQAPSDEWVEGRTTALSLDEVADTTVALPSQSPGTRRKFSPDLVTYGRAADVFVDLSTLSSDANLVILNIARGINTIVADIPDLSHTLSVSDVYVSARHARIVYFPSNRTLIVIDHGSQNGTNINIDGQLNRVFGEERFELKPRTARVSVQVGRTTIKIDLPSVAKRGLVAVPEITRRVTKLALAKPLFDERSIRSALAYALQTKNLRATISVNGDIAVEVRPIGPSVMGSIKFLFPRDTTADKISAISESLIDRIRPFKTAGTPTMDVIVTFMPRQDLYEKARAFRVDASVVDNGGLISLASTIASGTQAAFNTQFQSIGIIGSISDRDFGGQITSLPRIEIMLPIADDPAKMQKILEKAMNKAINAIGDLGLSREIEDELAATFKP